MKKIIRVFITICLLVVFPLSLYANDEDSDNYEDIKRPGTYFIEVKNEETGLSKTIRFTVSYPTTIINRDNMEGIQASDFRSEQDTIESLDKDTAVQLSNAYAWSTETGNAIEITSISVTKGDGLTSDYQVTLSTAKGTSTTVEGHIGDPILKMDNLNVNIRPMKEVSLLSFSIMLLIIFILPIVCPVLLSMYLRKKIKEANKVLYE